MDRGAHAKKGKKPIQRAADFPNENLIVKVTWNLEKSIFLSIVGNQLTAKSCWGFAARDTSESQFNIGIDDVADRVELSELDIIHGVSKEKRIEKVDATALIRAFRWIKRHGIMPTKFYQSGRDAERDVVNRDNKAVRFGEFQKMIPVNESELLSLVAKHPVAAVMEVDDAFKSYKGGIYRGVQGKSTGFSLSHAVTVVGYGTDEKEVDEDDNNLSYWIVRSSWGSSWGDKGYARVIRRCCRKDGKSCFDSVFYWDTERIVQNMKT